jgi:myo-inositol-1(or 4)-monophosphatase
MATGFADSRRTHAGVNLRNLDRMLHETRGVRRAGSAALDLAFTAAGRLDAFWEMGLKPWDVAAGIFLVKAAGGRISDMAGNPEATSGSSIVASNGPIHDWMLENLEMDPLFAASDPSILSGD